MLLLCLRGDGLSSFVSVATASPPFTYSVPLRSRWTPCRVRVPPPSVCICAALSLPPQRPKVRLPRIDLLAPPPVRQEVRTTSACPSGGPDLRLSVRRPGAGRSEARGPDGPGGWTRPRSNPTCSVQRVYSWFCGSGSHPDVLLLQQLYELDHDEKRKEFLDDLFSFMQKRVRPPDSDPLLRTCCRFSQTSRPLVEDLLRVSQTSALRPLVEDLLSHRVVIIVSGTLRCHLVNLSSSCPNVGRSLEP
ncbi:unnamed protein product [Boreogadus saida]